jgi:hypothetical protein
MTPKCRYWPSSCIRKQTTMRLPTIITATVWIMLGATAVAQTGGYPASPSHGIVGAPKADGTPRYGSEPGKKMDSSSDSADSHRSTDADRPGKDTDSATTGAHTDGGAKRTEHR